YVIYEQSPGIVAFLVSERCMKRFGGRDREYKRDGCSCWFPSHYSVSRKVHTSGRIKPQIRKLLCLRVPTDEGDRFIGRRPISILLARNLVQTQVRIRLPDNLIC